MKATDGIEPTDLGDRQTLFMRCVAQFIIEAHVRGLEVKMGWGFCPPGAGEMVKDEDGNGDVFKAYRKPTSMHGLMLAWDPQLFRGDEWLNTAAEWEATGMGPYWESLHPLCRWGGRFGDGNHISFAWDGRA